MSSSITLSEESGIRYLHFGTEWIQGAMNIKSPNILVLDYARQMMAWLLWHQKNFPPLKILQLGLGAGSLSKFCLTFLPADQLERLDVVDIDADVIQVAYTLFALPRNHPKLSVYQQDALLFVENRLAERSGQRYSPDFFYDVLQVDLYDKYALAPVHGNLAFYRLCAQHLHPTRGWLTLNLFGRHSSFQPNLNALTKVFPTVITLPRLPEGNIIVLCSRVENFKLDLEWLQAQAKTLKGTYSLNLARWISGMNVILQPAAIS